MPQRLRQENNTSQASIVRGQQSGKGPLEVEGSKAGPGSYVGTLLLMAAWRKEEEEEDEKKETGR